MEYRLRLPRRGLGHHATIMWMFLSFSIFEIVVKPTYSPAQRSIHLFLHRFSLPVVALHSEVGLRRVHARAALSIN